MDTFITHDGLDDNNVRAEVYVQKGFGNVTEIKENKAGTADVVLTVPNLKYPIHGWVDIESAIFEEAKKHLASGEETSFRIESQRKTGVDRTTPISELRKDPTKARTTVITILAELNNVVSQEAVTLAEEDPATKQKGRIKATKTTPPVQPKQGTNVGRSKDELLTILSTLMENDMFTNDVASHLAAQAIAAGATVEEIQTVLTTHNREDRSFPQQSSKAFSVEAPSWKNYNTDGRFNLGHGTILATAGVESYVRHYLDNNTTLDFNDTRYTDAVTYLTSLILAIGDKIQTTLYGAGFRADRSASSHVKIRAIVFDTINNYYSIPFRKDNTLNSEETQLWVKNVGNMAYQRYKNIIDITNMNLPTTQPIPESLTSETPTPAETEATQEPEMLAEEPVKETTVDETPPQVGDEIKEKPTSETTETTSEITTDSTVKYPTTLLDESLLESGKLNPDIAATEETISMFKEMVEEFNLSKEEISKISKLLAATFGTKFVKAQLIPDETLLEFIDFYVASGAENFQEILKGL